MLSSNSPPTLSRSTNRTTGSSRRIRRTEMLAHATPFQTPFQTTPHRAPRSRRVHSTQTTLRSSASLHSIARSLQTIGMVWYMSLVTRLAIPILLCRKHLRSMMGSSRWRPFGSDNAMMTRSPNRARYDADTRRSCNHQCFYPRHLRSSTAGASRSCRPTARRAAGTERNGRHCVVSVC